MSLDLPKLPFMPKAVLYRLDAPGDCSYKLSSYGADLANNKHQLWRTLVHLPANAAEKRLIVAMAMQETTQMRIDQRDASKDGTMSANVSILNMNFDMVQTLGYSGNDFGSALNLPENFGIALSYAVLGIRTWGAKRFLDFHRGGRTGFTDGVSYDCYGYRNSVATMLPLLNASLELASSNDQRIEIAVAHV